MINANQDQGCLWIQQQQPWMIEQTLKLALIQSGSDHTVGLAAMLDALIALWQPLDASTCAVSLPKVKHLQLNGKFLQQPNASGFHAVKRPDAPLQILLTGHLDTVFPKTTTFTDNTYLTDNKVNGPGVADMKGGLIVMLVALMAFERTTHAQNLGWQVAINPDEETGSHASATWLQNCAQTAHVGMVFEPALADGQLAGARKGSGNYTLKITGKSAHAGRAFKHGINAITAMASFIQQLDLINHKRAGLQVNIAGVQGGEAFNIVPEMAVCRFNVRADDQASLVWFEQQLEQILLKIQQQVVAIELDGRLHRPAKPLTPATQQLLKWLQQSSKPLGLNLSQQPTGGCCDGNNLAAIGLPTLDTLGVRGGNIHTEDEFIVLDSLAERAQMNFLFLSHLADQPSQVIANRKS